MSMFSIASSSDDARPRHRLLERVERHRDEVDGPDAVPLERGHVLGQLAAGQDAAVDLGVERLHPPVEHLGEAGDLGHVHHRDAGLAQQLGGAAGGEDLGAERGQAARELHHPGLVVHADEGASHSSHGVSLMSHAAAADLEPALARRGGPPPGRSGAPRRGCGRRGWPRCRPAAPAPPPAARWGRCRRPRPRSARWRPDTRTPCSRAWRCGCRPGKAGSSDGWMLSRRPAKWATKPGLRSRM